LSQSHLLFFLGLPLGFLQLDFSGFLAGDFLAVFLEELLFFANNFAGEELTFLYPFFTLLSINFWIFSLVSFLVVVLPSEPILP
jgi:hypothetical protein